jgi:hypothetical protein
VALSTVTVTGTWVTPANAAPASGTVIFQPVIEATGGGYIVAGSPVTATLNAGQISIVLVNNTQVVALQYQVTETIAGAPAVVYYITPSGANLDLSSVARNYTTTAIPGYLPVSSVGAVNGTTDWYNVRQYGATGSGSTDDTAAIQNAINAAGAGGTVYFPAGTYLVSATLTGYSGATYIGDGWQSLIKQKNGANLSAVFSWPSTASPAYSNCYMVDLMIDGNRTNNTGATTYGIYAYALQYSNFRHVRVQNVNGDGWRFDGTTGGFSYQSNTVHLENCWSYGNANNGLVTTSYTADIHLHGGDYGFNGASAVTLQGGSSSIRSAVLWGTTSGPGLIIGAPSIQVTGCNIEGNNQQGVVINQYGSYSLITGCKVYDNSVAGSGSYDGVYINGVSGTNTTAVFVLNNAIYPNLNSGGTTQRYAVYLGTYHQNCQVIGNVVGFAGSQAAWSPSNTLISGEGQSDWITNNPGFNPVGKVTAPAIPTSGTTMSNPWGFPVTVYVSGGTVTGIQVDSNSIGLTAGAIHLGPNDTITLTYSAAPTWLWIGE